MAEITEETYLEMLRLISDYKKNKKVDENNSPYFYTAVVETTRKYNPKYGDNRMCVCGHVYHRHFDSYENMDACGCKYCQCYEFEEDLTKKEKV